ncbi:hypothetical protein P5G50_05765 [Leifsonia sp. F6_8S_P_1B]|uniref:Uncharacterized protein n=1 Tax=Leifsonia williamsii TaxID=3035919 RepID=A0ABT8KA89_9MICO|nr:hypothetical protein [Leifsonia williamsii]MDN4613957.1 hypothetical protein [Leifsonia williamsii]
MENDAVTEVVIVERRRRWVVATAFTIVIVAAAVGAVFGWQSFARTVTAATDRDLARASAALSAATDVRGSALDKAHAALSSLEAYAAQPRPAYLPEATAKALSDAHATVAETSKGLTYAPFEEPHVAPLPDLLPWTILDRTQRSEAITRRESAETKAYKADARTLDAAVRTLSSATTAVYKVLASQGEQVLSADSSSTYASRIELRHAIDAGASGVMSAQFGGSGLLRIMSTIDAVNASQAAGEAAKQDPAYPVRARIEEYARSIAHGVTLDVEYHQLVSGLGDGWYSGTTQYNETDGGWATIDLNYSVQDGFARGDVDAKALITHEVGHAQVVRPECKPLFEGPVFNRDDEMWATAWAISLGFDTGGAGIEAYGRPSDEQIAVAGQCR